MFVKNVDRMTSVMLLVVMLGVFIEASQAIECYVGNGDDLQLLDCGERCATVHYETGGALRLILLE